ncbi:unnamed protein product [Rotaria magnacalcarata]
MTANDSSSTSCTCIIDIKNRVRFLKEINDTCPTILATNECYMDLPQAPLYCSITNYWFIIWKIIIFGAFILDIIIPIVIWGRSSKPNILFSLAAFGIIIAESNDENIIHRERLTTRIYIFSLIGFLILVGIAAGLVVRTANKIEYLPSQSKFVYFAKVYSNHSDLPMFKD